MFKRKYAEAYYLDGRTAFVTGWWQTRPDLLASVTRLSKPSRLAWWQGFHDARVARNA